MIRRVRTRRDAALSLDLINLSDCIPSREMKEEGSPFERSLPSANHVLNAESHMHSLSRSDRSFVNLMLTRDRA